MDHGFEFVCRTKTKRLIWLSAIIFTTIILIQYFELPYVNVLSSVLPAGKPISSGEDLSSNSDNKNETIISNFGIGLSSTPISSVSSNNSRNQTELSSNGSDFLALSPTISPANDHIDLNDTTKIPAHRVISISEMNELLLQSRASHSVEFKTTGSLSKVDEELVYARSQIENAPILMNDSELYTPLFRNISMFKRSYELMEQTLKVYIYKEGEKPVFHQPMLKGIYASEGWFMKLMEANQRYITQNPEKAHLFYLPFSVRMLVDTLYVRNSPSDSNLVQYLKNYVDAIVAKYPFWNRTGGADHFLVACHDWGPMETKEHMRNCIRALCNANINEGFKFEKDVSLPGTLVSSPKSPLRELGGNPASDRPILAFFAGKLHGYLRPVLLHYWGYNKDPKMKIFGKLPKVRGNKEYINYMKSSKYCICARGYEVSTPRVVEAIYYECVPVIIADNFVPPFFEVLNWELFSVFVKEIDVPKLKEILMSISEEKYVLMQQRVKLVQQHFLWHAEPVKYDIFNMILHSIWYKRVFQMNPS